MIKNVSRLGFGAWAIGSKSYGSINEDAALDTLSCYVEGGGNFIDTARGYGESERIIGRFLLSTQGLREKLFLCSKTPALDESAIKRDIETSLSLLGTDYLDLFYLHSPPEDPRERDRVLKVFQSLKEQGIIRNTGASVKGPNVTPETQDMCRQYMATGMVDALQLILSIIRQTNRDIIQQAKVSGIAIIARTSLESGFLTGKYKPGFRFPASDHRHRWSPESLDRTLKEAERLERDTGEFDSLAQMALRFSYDEPGVTSLIAGAKSRSQMERNFEALEKTGLSDDWRSELINGYSDRYDLGNFL